ACPLRRADPFPAQPESTAITKPSYTTPKDAIELARSSHVRRVRMLALFHPELADPEDVSLGLSSHMETFHSY
ncbi:hypothetical protein, partial [Neorhizobium galegae]|uniref:hypothetical protein n=1 Tax=Neorhizobium galegae TaxID=399 RepID=UPI0027D7FE13